MAQRKRDIYSVFMPYGSSNITHASFRGNKEMANDKIVVEPNRSGGKFGVGAFDCSVNDRLR